MAPPRGRGATAAAGAALILGLAAGCSSRSGPAVHDLIVRGGTVYDGSGAPGRRADVIIDGDRVVAVGDASHLAAAREIDARGLAVAPGFINVLSWATESLIEDGRSQSDVRQGVTLEVFGEGWSFGPLNDAMREEVRARQSLIRYPVEWTTLAGYLDFLVDRGVAPNVASFVGATTVRIHELGYEDRAPTAEELDRMRQLVRTAMEEGALGLGSSLIYTPAYFADTDELVALAEVVAEYDGLYISHLRNESDRLLEAFGELVEIAERAGVRAEVYHLKAAGDANHRKLDEVVAAIAEARDRGLDITADMYTYIAGATGLDATMPPWVQEGGYDAWAERLSDAAVRRRLMAEMRDPEGEWENLLRLAGAEGVLLSGFRNEALRPLTGRTLAEVAAMRGTSPEETAIDLVIEDGSRVEAVYFLMSEENVERQIALPYMAFCSDAASLAPEGVFLEASPHPRAYGNFARLLGRYVRERRVIPLEEAIHRLTGMTADRLRIADRGRLTAGAFADVVVFDPETIQDHATFEEPHRYSTGVLHVLVNGVPVLEDGEHTGATPGRVVRGPGEVRKVAARG